MASARPILARLGTAFLVAALLGVPLAAGAHDHEPCHRGLHVAPPHAGAAPEGSCTVCRASQARAPEASPARGAGIGPPAEIVLDTAELPRAIERAAGAPPRAPPVLPAQA